MHEIVFPTKNESSLSSDFDILTETDKSVIEDVFEFILMILYGNRDYPFIPFAVTNNRKEKIPHFNIFNELPCIHLTISSFNYWCQVIYQFSHEFAHLLMYETDKNFRVPASWLEEMIAEAFSCFALKKFQQYWPLCNLSKQNVTFSKSIGEYLEDIMAQPGTSALKSCHTIKELEMLNETSENHRENHREEMKKLYSLIDEKNVFALFDYRRFCCTPTFVFDEIEYRRTYPSNSAVAYVCDLQQSIYRRAHIRKI